MRCPSTTRLDEIYPSIFMHMPVLLKWLVRSLLIPCPPVDPAAARGQYCHRPVSLSIFSHDFHQASAFLSISPADPQGFSTEFLPRYS
jgi:hypothetical protein